MYILFFNRLNSITCVSSLFCPFEYICDLPFAGTVQYKDIPLYSRVSIKPSPDSRHANGKPTYHPWLIILFTVRRFIPSVFRSCVRPYFSIKTSRFFTHLIFCAALFVSIVSDEALHHKAISPLLIPYPTSALAHPSSPLLL